MLFCFCFFVCLFLIFHNLFVVCFVVVLNGHVNLQLSCPDKNTCGSPSGREVSVVLPHSGIAPKLDPTLSRRRGNILK